MKIFSFLLLTALLSESPARAAPYGSGFYDTSEYFMGRVAVAIVFVESDGTGDPNAEDWTTTEKNDVVAEIQAAMTWWAGRESRANLSFVYVTTTIATQYEPINRPQTDESLWISQTMGKLGYTESYYFNRARHYMNDIRDANNTDWAFAVFAVDSSNDADGKFSDNTYFAYAYLGGPFQVMTYDNGGYGISNMRAVAAHETGHIFYAQDEYASACTGNEYTGYLNVKNYNCEDLGGVACIMRGQVTPYTNGQVCSYTREMLGWRDSNANNIFDIIDFPPDTVLNAYMPDPTSDDTPSYTGTAYSTAVYVNSNPNHPEGASASNNININYVSGVEYRVDAGSWLSAPANDGSFNSASENYSFTTASLLNGLHTIEARSKNNLSVYDPSIPSDSLSIDIGLPADITIVNDGLSTDIDYVNSLYALSANWTASSHGTGINRYEYAIGTSPGAVNVVNWANNALNLSVTRTGLSLTDAVTYYFSVKAVSNGGPETGSTISDGQKVDITSPTAKIEIQTPVPAKTGFLNLKLVLNEANALVSGPFLKFRQQGSSDDIQIPLSFFVSSTYTGTSFIESYYSTGTAVFYFNAADIAGNNGTVITSGENFLIDTAVSGISGGTIVNSDSTTVILPGGFYSGNVIVVISTASASITDSANSNSPDSLPIVSVNLNKDFSAKTPAGVPITNFNSPVTIRIYYPDANGDGRVDGDYFDEKMLNLYYLDPSLMKWTAALSQSRDADQNFIQADVQHFSVYSIRAFDSSVIGMDKIKAYPNPCRIASYNLTIGGIPVDASDPKIYIYNSVGELVKILEKNAGIDALSTGTWNGRNSSGEKAASGLYVYLVKTSNYGKSSGKFVILW
ncbi:MAG: hypothetical protein HY746_08395 [Elusimicrobia bacterium]|nr:hypothetical protein [Elusimicrobiota bacterium]